MTEQAVIDGRAFPLVSNTKLPLIGPDTPIVATQVFEDPMSRQKPEGVAVLREPDEAKCDEFWWEGRVEFVDEPGQHYGRRVYRGSSL